MGSPIPGDLPHPKGIASTNGVTYLSKVSGESASMTEIETRPSIGQRIVVTGMAGAGKSTLSRVLAEKTGLPLIHLDLHIWKPGWIRVPADELLEKQRTLLAGERWIVDGNDVDRELLAARADTLIVLDMPWWLCAWRAFKRGLRRPPGTQLPDGCDDSTSQRLRDEWGIVWRNWRHRKSIRQRELSLASHCQGLMPVYVLRSKQACADFASNL